MTKLVCQGPCKLPTEDAKVNRFGVCLCCAKQWADTMAAGDKDGKLYFVEDATAEKCMEAKKPTPAEAPKLEADVDYMLCKQEPEPWVKLDEGSVMPGIEHTLLLKPEEKEALRGLIHSSGFVVKHDGVLGRWILSLYLSNKANYVPYYWWAENDSIKGGLMVHAINPLPEETITALIRNHAITVDELRVQRNRAIVGGTLGAQMATNAKPRTATMTGGGSSAPAGPGAYSHGATYGGNGDSVRVFPKKDKQVVFLEFAPGTPQLPHYELEALTKRLEEVSKAIPYSFLVLPPGLHTATQKVYSFHERLADYEYTISFATKEELMEFVRESRSKPKPT